MSENGTPILKDVPSLDALALNPGLVTELPGPVVQHILIQVACLLPALLARSHSAPATDKSQEDRLLDIDEAATVLSKTKDWLYRNADDLPFTVREGRLLRFSSQGIQRYIRARLRQG